MNRNGRIEMASSRRRFLMHAAAMGGAAFAHPGRTLAVAGEPATSAAGAAPETFSPPELLARQAARARRAAAHPATAPSAAAQSGGEADYAAMYRDRRNWGRWGDGDQVGAINLITPEKRAAAAGLVRTGRTVSLSRVFEPPQHFIQKSSRGPGGGYVMDYLGFIYHGSTITHVDALCHIWDDDGMWQGHDPDVEITTQGAQFGDITHWSGGIITKGVLIDVPRHRGEPHVSIDEPVRGDSRRSPVPRASPSRPVTRCWSTAAGPPTWRAATTAAAGARGCIRAARSSSATTTWRCSVGT
jgi:hypothetical protein